MNSSAVRRMQDMHQVALRVGAVCFGNVTCEATRVSDPALLSYGQYWPPYKYTDENDNEITYDKAMEMLADEGS